MTAYRLMAGWPGNMTIVRDYASYRKACRDFELALVLNRLIGSADMVVNLVIEEVPDNG